VAGHHHAETCYEQSDLFVMRFFSNQI